jgi:hypothetical protein
LNLGITLPKRLYQKRCNFGRIYSEGFPSAPAGESGH